MKNLTISLVALAFIASSAAFAEETAKTEGKKVAKAEMSHGKHAGKKMKKDKHDMKKGEHHEDGAEHHEGGEETHN